MVIVSGPHYEKEFKKFDFVSETALEEEMTKSLEKADENVNFDKFSAQARAQARLNNGNTCCKIN